MLWRSRNTIPKQFRTDRPSAHPILRSKFTVRVEAVLLIAGVGIAAMQPLQSWDRQLSGSLILSQTDQNPSPPVTVLTLSAKDLQDRVCDERLPLLVGEARSHEVVFLTPAESFCSLPDSKSQALGFDDLKVVGGDRVVGFAPSAISPRSSFVHAPWVLPSAPESIPVVSFTDVEARHVPLSVLRDRVVVATLEDRSGRAPALAKNLAGAISGVLLGNAHRSASALLVALISTLAGASLWFSRRRFGALGTVAGYAILGALFLALHLGFSSTLGILPLGSLWLGSTIHLSGILGAAFLHTRRVVRRATETLERIALFRTQGLEKLSDADFFSQVERFATLAHPADYVLVAELAPRKWHLKFWNDVQSGQSLIKERRRDVRRTPYSNEHGTPSICVTRRLLVRPDVPVVVVPLIAFGELEGYVFLCGSSAEAAYAADPTIASRLSRELALLVRRRRQSTVQASDDRMFSAHVIHELALLDGARMALDEVELFQNMLRSAPVGIAYADSFGDLRFAGDAFSEWLTTCSLPFPMLTNANMIPPGALTLKQLLSTAGHSGSDLALVLESEEGLVLPVPSGRGTRTLDLMVRPVRKTHDGGSFIAGYVLVLSDKGEVRGVAPSRVEHSLSAFSLSEFANETRDQVLEATGRQIRLEPTRGLVHAIGDRTELGIALKEFLIEVCDFASPGEEPVLALRGGPHAVELRIFDVVFGVPEVLLERVLIAPASPPIGLERLARLVLAVQDSHGAVQLKSKQGWGNTLTLSFVRARPRVFYGSAAPMSFAPMSSAAPSSTSNVVAITRASKYPSRPPKAEDAVG